MEKKKLNRDLANFEFQEGDDKLIEQLSPEHREILGQTGKYHEIAAALNIESVGTIRSRLHRARASLVKLRKGQPVTFTKKVSAAEGTAA